jgi:hypothetical protein
MVLFGALRALFKSLCGAQYTQEFQLELTLQAGD